MRKILKEQASTQDPTLSVILSDCGWKGYQLGVNKSNNKPALIQNVPGKGVVYLYNDFTFEALSADGKLNNSGSYSACEAAKGKIEAPLGPDQTKFIEGLLGQNKGFAKLSDEVKKGLGTGTYKQIDLYSLKPELFTKPNVHFIYQLTSIANEFINQMPNIEAFFKKLGYTLTEPKYGTAEYNSGKDALDMLNKNGGASLVDEFTATLQKNGKPVKGLQVWKSSVNVEKGKATETVKNLLASIEGTKMGRKECQISIKLLYKLATGKVQTRGVEPADVENAKENSYMCATQGTNYLKGIMGIQDEIDFLKRNNGPFGLRSKFEQALKESKDDLLKSIIKTKLSMLSESKKKTLVSENKIIKSRFNVITESKKVKIDSVSDLIHESFDLVNLGLTPKLVSEGLMDSLSGLFGIGTEGILGYFKEKIVETILNKLGIDTDSWIAGTIVKAIGNIPIGDYASGKILTCDYLTPLIAKSIAEESLDKVKDKAGLTGGFYDVLRNAIVQGLDSTDFAQSIERGLASAICPTLSKIGGNMDGVFNTMKQKALS